ncbi:MAG: hypothetical protein U0W24_18575 [Bacteroidales bacterium]
MHPTFEYCSLKYLDIYQQIEKNIIEGLKQENNADRLEILKNGATAFRIARNFKDFDNDNNKDNILSILDKIKTPKTDSESIETVINFSNSLSKLFPGKNYYSASSKFLWLKFQSPIIIMDSRTIKALDKKLKPENYSQYYSLWKQTYSKYEKQIVKSCLGLPSVKNYFYNPDMDISEIIHSKWFHERVFDIYLWEIGGI